VSVIVIDCTTIGASANLDAASRSDPDAHRAVELHRK
jgi:hypothetical protein